MIPREDLIAMDAALADVWPAFDGARIFMTGGTGFIGRWMLAAIVRAGVRAELVLLSRDPQAFAARAPDLAERATLVRGDVTDFTPPPGGFTHVVHGATDASAWLTANLPDRMFNTIVEGTRRVLSMANADNRMLCMSSGAVYGRQPCNLGHVGEDFAGGPDITDPRSAYAEGKRAAETLCAIHARTTGAAIVTARIFALLGPLSPLDTHFAAGNFIRDAMAGRTIRVNGPGRAVRSYLYAADLAVWLWTMLARAPAGGTWNVGSEDAVSVADLARRIARLLGAPGVEILGADDAGWNPGRYVPSTARIARDLNLTPTVDLAAAIRRTAASYGWTP